MQQGSSRNSRAPHLKRMRAGTVCVLWAFSLPTQSTDNVCESSVLSEGCDYFWVFMRLRVIKKYLLLQPRML